MSGKYDDIINLPHHVSSTRPHMPMSDRAAQFSPFAALSGYGAAVKETARLTSSRIELAEDARAMLEQKLRLLADTAPDDSIVTITYFQPDTKKTGGSYVTVTGPVKKVDGIEHIILMSFSTITSAVLAFSDRSMKRLKCSLNTLAARLTASSGTKVPFVNTSNVSLS